MQNNSTNILKDIEKNIAHVYTDGGSRGNGNSDSLGGWAYLIHYNDNELFDSAAVPNQTNNQMELKAMIEALKKFNSVKESISVVVYSDSAYCVNGINDWIKGWKKKNWIGSNKQPVKNVELWKELDDIRNTFNDIKFVKVKGHSTDIGNNFVDELLNKAMDQYKEES